MFEKLKDEFWTFCEITERKSSIIYWPMALTIICLIVGTVINKIGNNILENQAGFMTQLYQTMGMYIELAGLGIMFFGFVGYFILTSHLYTKEKRRLERLY